MNLFLEKIYFSRFEIQVKREIKRNERKEEMMMNKIK